MVVIYVTALTPVAALAVTAGVVIVFNTVQAELLKAVMLAVHEGRVFVLKHTSFEQVPVKE